MSLPLRVVLRPDNPVATEIRDVCFQLGVVCVFTDLTIKGDIIGVIPQAGDVLVDCGELDLHARGWQPDDPAGLSSVTMVPVQDVPLFRTTLAAAAVAGRRGRPCYHETFICKAEMIRAAAGPDSAADAFVFQAWVSCNYCGSRLRFIGCPPKQGIDLDAPSASPCFTELRVPVTPEVDHELRQRALAAAVARSHSFTDGVCTRCGQPHSDILVRRVCSGRPC